MAFVPVVHTDRPRYSPKIPVSSRFDPQLMQMANGNCEVTHPRVTLPFLVSKAEDDISFADYSPGMKGPALATICTQPT